LYERPAIKKERKEGRKKRRKKKKERNRKLVSNTFFVEKGPAADATDTPQP
jgi:hypothetical protein